MKLRSAWLAGIVLALAIPASAQPVSVVLAAQDSGGKAERGESSPRGSAILEQFNRLPPEEQRKMLEKLPPERRRQLLRQLEEYRNMSPQQRRRLRQRLDRFSELTPAQQERTRQIYRQFHDLPPERRRAVRQAFQNLRRLTPEQRQRRMENPRFQERFNERERNLLREMQELNADLHDPNE